jgi:hypothetical protein
MDRAKGPRFTFPTLTGSMRSRPTTVSTNPGRTRKKSDP